MIVVTGARGFIGRALCAVLVERGLTVVRVGRGEGADVRWPKPGQPFGPDAVAAFSRARAVVHLAGETIGERWTASRRRAIRESRVDLTATLAAALAASAVRPGALISGSAVGIYGNRGDEWLTETSTIGSDFLGEVARDWEAATEPARAAGIRVVTMRTGVVLGPGGGMIAKLRLPFSLGLGARLGSGRQWMSWISLDDTVQFILRAMDDAALTGPINLTSPNPVTNAEFTTTLAHVMGRPALLATPRFALRAAFGEMADGILLASQRVRPARLIEAGFRFAYPELEGALRHALER